MDYEARLKRVRDEMRRQNVGLMYLPYAADLLYLTGVQRKLPEMTDANFHYHDYVCGGYIGADGGLTLVGTRQGRAFVEKEAQRNWVDETRIVQDSDVPEKILPDIIRRFDLKGRGVALGEQAGTKTALIFINILPDCPISSASEIVTPMRMVKDADEIAVMKEISRITVDAYGEVIKCLKVGITEFDVVHEINYQLYKRGVEFPSFPGNIFFTKPGKPWMRGIRVMDRKLETGDSICFDFGGCFKGYCTDFGRTAFVGEPPPEFLKMYALVKKTHSVVLKAMAERLTGSQLDEVARSMIGREGYGDYFIHGLGHGIGLSVHEPPFAYSGDKNVLVPGMTLAIEPSIRLPNGYACRLEDEVMVTEKGGVPLTDFHRELTIIQ